MSADMVTERVTTVTPLGVAPHDLLTDRRVTDGLRVEARPVDGGRVSVAFRTLSGAYAFRGLDGLRALEFPARGAGGAASPALGGDFVVSIIDARGRFVPLVLVVPVPTWGLVSLHDVVLSVSPPDALVPPTGSPGPRDDSPPHADLPLYLFAAPDRTLPSHVGAVRAQVAYATDGAPAAFCRVEVVVDPSSPGRRRALGIADHTGTVVVPFHYPRFGSAPGNLTSPPDAGTRGQPPGDRSWPVQLRVRSEPGALDRRPGLPAPTFDSVLTQRAVDVRPTRGGVPQPSLQTDVTYGTDLVARTVGDADSRLLIGGSSS